MFRVIESPDLEEINKAMTSPDYLQADFRVEHRLQAHPGRHAGAMEFAGRGDAITGERGSRLPLKAGAIIEQRKSRGKCVLRPQEINITEGTTTSLGQDVNSVAGPVQDFDRLPGDPQFLVERLIGIASETQENGFTGRAGFRLPAQGREEIGTRDRTAEIVPLPSGSGRSVAIRAGVITPAVDIAGEGRVFAGAARRFIN